MTAEQTELIEKLNCLEFETSQLNQAYQLWRSNVERGTPPDWMAAAIRITYDALIMVCLETASAPSMDTSHAGESECFACTGETAPPPKRALSAEDSTTALCLRPGERLQYEHAKTDPPVYFTALVDGSLALTPVRQQNRIAGMLALADVPRAFSARQLAELEATASEISYVLGEDATIAEPSPEILPMNEAGWSDPSLHPGNTALVVDPGAEMPLAISRPPASDVSSQPGIQLGRHEEEAEVEPAAFYRLATLRLPDWLQGSTTRLFGAASAAVLAVVAILMVAGGAMGIYLASPKRAVLSSGMVPAQNSAPQSQIGAVVIPTGEKAEFKFDPDPVVAPLGSSFVLNAVLSRGSDIASVGVQIDYDPNVLQFMGVSEGGFLVKAGQNFVLAQRDDPLAGVLKINAEQSPGTPGISGAGPVFALSFHARKKGNGTISIVPGAHDSQGRRIEMTGSQVSVRVN